MAQGKLVHGICYATDGEVISAIAAEYPITDNGEIWYLKNMPVVSLGKFTYTVWSGKSYMQDSVTLEPPVCDTSIVPADPLFAVVMFAASSIMFALGFIGTR